MINYSIDLTETKKLLKEVGELCATLETKISLLNEMSFEETNFGDTKTLKSVHELR